MRLQLLPEKRFLPTIVDVARAHLPSPSIHPEARCRRVIDPYSASNRGETQHKCPNAFQSRVFEVPVPLPRGDAN